jgi:glycosyltransferase involved in cell wall biosynthesis
VSGPRLTSLSAFVPAFNEAGNIERVVDRLHRALERVADEHEVIVVLYAGCTDGTDRVVDRLLATDARLRLVVQPRDRRGYGVALRLGIEAARYDYIFYTDADDQFDPEEIDRLIALLAGHELVTGYRIDRQDPLPRILTARVYNWIIDLTLGTSVRDVDCAFKIYRRSLFSHITLRSDTGLIDAEIIGRARRAGLGVAEVGVHHYPRAAGRAHFESGGLGLPSPKVVLGVLGELWRLRQEITRAA